MTARYSNILFDLDGTVTDPKEGITKSILHALDKLNICEPNMDSLTRFIGPPLKVSFREYYNLGDEEIERAIAYYREYFSVRGLFENKVYPGIADMLSFLQMNECTLFVATSKPTVYAKQILSHFGVDRFFSQIEGSGLDGTLSDKSDLIEHMIRTYGLSPRRTVMIGDRKHDIVGARNNQLDSIAVTWGYGSRTELIAAGATWYVDSVEELQKTLMDET